MVSSLEGDRGEVVVGDEEGGLLGDHIETDVVLVTELDTADGVGVVMLGMSPDTSVGDERGSRGEVRLVPAVVGGVDKTEVEVLDIVGETDIGVGSSGRAVGVVGASDGLLSLDHVDIADTAAHLLTLVVGEESIVAVARHLGDLGDGARRELGSREGLGGNGGAVVLPDGEELVDGGSDDVKADLLVGESSHGDTDTGVLIEVEGERNDDVLLGEAGSVPVETLEVKIGGIANHIEVTITLASGDSESVEEIHVERSELLGNKIGKVDASLLEEVVAEALDPLGTVTVDRGGAGGEGSSLSEDNGGDIDNEVGVEEDITSTSDLDLELGASLGSSGNGETSSGNGEPGRLDDLRDEVGDSILATISISGGGGEGSKIDVSGSSVDVADSRFGHFIIGEKIFFKFLLFSRQK